MGKEREISEGLIDLLDDVSSHPCNLLFSLAMTW